jgi:hypothetical protein
MAVWPYRLLISFDTTGFKENKLGSTQVLIWQEGAVKLLLRNLELCSLKEMRTCPFICVTSVFLTHLVLNLEHLERHTPSKNINMET